MDLLLTGQIQFSLTETPDVRPPWRRSDAGAATAGRSLRCGAPDSLAGCDTEASACLARRGAPTLTCWPQRQQSRRFKWKMS
jgi:hypothetical protein